MMRVGVPFAVLLALTACNGTTAPRACTLEARAGINLTVVDSTTGQPISNASATAREGAFQETLQPSPSHELFGLFERKGTYDVVVSAPDYQTWRAENVIVDADECHVIPVRLTARLAPAS